MGNAHVVGSRVYQPLGFCHGYHQCTLAALGGSQIFFYEKTEHKRIAVDVFTEGRGNQSELYTKVVKEPNQASDRENLSL